MKNETLTSTFIEKNLDKIECFLAFCLVKEKNLENFVFKATLLLFSSHFVSTSFYYRLHINNNYSLRWSSTCCSSPFHFNCWCPLWLPLRCCWWPSPSVADAAERWIIFFMENLISTFFRSPRTHKRLRLGSKCSKKEARHSRALKWHRMRRRAAAPRWRRVEQRRRRRNAPWRQLRKCPAIPCNRLLLVRFFGEKINSNG